MAVTNCDGKHRRLDVDEAVQPDLIAHEKAAPRSTNGNLILGYDAEVSGAWPAFEPRNDMRCRDGISERRRVARPKRCLYDHLREERTIGRRGGPDSHSASVSE